MLACMNAGQREELDNPRPWLKLHPLHFGVAGDEPGRATLTEAGNHQAVLCRQLAFQLPVHSFQLTSGQAAGSSSSRPAKLLARTRDGTVNGGACAASAVPERLAGTFATV